jgi:predicted nucleic acid-binding protein
MEQYFLDTNIFLRHFLNDHPVYSPAARELLRAVEQGNVSAWTSDLVIAEIVFVLSNKQTYRLSPAQIRDLLLPVLSLPHLKLAHKKLYPRIFDLYVSLGIDYIDAYNAALVLAQKDKQIASFDRDFDKVLGITRKEPALPPQ